jgi:hypothetical protein
MDHALPRVKVVVIGEIAAACFLLAYLGADLRRKKYYVD